MIDTFQKESRSWEEIPICGFCYLPPSLYHFVFNCKHNYNISFYLSVHHNRSRVMIMEELKITKRTEPVMFTIRVDKSIVDFYDDLAQKTNRSRNELIGLALEYAKDKIKIEP